MATWDDIQRDFKERADRIESDVNGLLVTFKVDLEQAIKAAREDQINATLQDVVTRLKKIEEQLEEKDEDVVSVPSGRRT